MTDEILSNSGGEVIDAVLAYAKAIMERDDKWTRAWRDAIVKRDEILRARVEKLEGLLRDGVEAVQGSATRRGAWAARAHSETMR